MEDYLAPSPLLDFKHPSIQDLIRNRDWMKLDAYDRIGAIYDFVRNEIAFGYNREDAIPASEVLQDGYGQCNTKSSLFMALLRACAIPCRLHGFTIAKALQEGAIFGIWYRMAPPSILHTWVEVYYEGRWLKLEGFILDDPYLKSLQKQFADCEGRFCGYGVYTYDFANPPIQWKGADTFIQSEGINQDFGLYLNPDAFYLGHRQQFNAIKKFLYQNFIRHRLNRRLNKIRSKV
ncbi:transglutaminase-like domain-containing protein [Croceimicrobium sp.]|uniref:transglutaminase-like domain-containing protein n=1 Tax=Croceimicrobium sp. TaxID=2828340 RepID=UPI003BAB645C